ncbi:MAG: CarD family transcriptional regulator [Acidobacteria bacterium]|nr:CarD family transcriptional regulator [Acidobacteriota bacterium]
MHFNIGDKVIYPNHGLGVVETITRQKVLGQEIQFYQLRLLENNSMILVPVQNAETIGLRGIISKKDARNLLFLLQMANPEVKQQIKEWKSRFRENTERMKSGRITDVVEVVRILAKVNSRKSLSFREKKMYDKAKRLLVSELAAAENMPEDAVERQIDQALVVSLSNKNIGNA